MSLVVYKQKHMDIKEIDQSLVGQDLLVCGWVRNLRFQSTMAFVEVYDGSTSKPLQMISEDPLIHDQLRPLSVGSAISVVGRVVAHPTKNYEVELRIETVEFASKVADPLHYPLNAKKMSLEFLRSHKEIRVKTRTMNAVFRIRAALSHATHLFFRERGFHHLNPNILTTSDCEGGGEVFTVTTLDLDKPIADRSQDFFGQPTFLTVSSQLELEALCAGLGKVWTSNKSFRAERSRTSRHLAEFEHIEWEMAWASLEDLMDLAECYTQFSIRYVLENQLDDLEELNKFTSKGLIGRLQGFIGGPYARISYDEAIKLLAEPAAVAAALPPVQWGDDLGSECENYLATTVFGKPLFVYNYPASLKSFYMRANTDGRTVQGCDLLIPGLGELIGSSVREHDYDRLMKVVAARGMDPASLQWYIDLRKNGSTPTAGAGLGFDRLVRICTGMENIRDAVPFPVTY